MTWRYSSSRYLCGCTALAYPPNISVFSKEWSFNILNTTFQLPVQVQESKRTSSAHWADTNPGADCRDEQGTCVSTCLGFMAQTPTWLPLYELSMGSWYHWYLLEQVLNWCLQFYSKELSQSVAMSQNVAPFVDHLVRSSCIWTNIVIFPSKLSQELGKESPHEICRCEWDHRVKTFIPLRLWLHPKAWGRWNPTQLELNT